jgi:hypothetical protein
MQCNDNDMQCKNDDMQFVKPVAKQQLSAHAKLEILPCQRTAKKEGALQLFSFAFHSCRLQKSAK